MVALLRRQVEAVGGTVPRTLTVKTITADNGTEFHGYEELEGAFPIEFYFATPYHSWERGTNENTNGLIRQYLPKQMNMRTLSQATCDWTPAS
jgi:IS30 family transposase